MLPPAPVKSDLEVLRSAPFRRDLDLLRPVPVRRDIEVVPKEPSLLVFGDLYGFCKYLGLKAKVSFSLEPRTW